MIAPGDTASTLGGALTFIFDPTSTTPTYEIATLSIPYSVTQPQLKFLGVNPAATVNGEDIWYQITNPGVVDTSVTPIVVSPIPSQSCGAVSGTPAVVVAYATSYQPTADATALSGTFLKVSYQFVKPLGAVPTATCAPGASVTLTTQSGAPATVTLPSQ